MGLKKGLRGSLYYGMALLKVSQEIKHGADPYFEKLFDDTLAEQETINSSFNKDEFYRFLEETRQELEEIAREIGL